MYFSPLSYLIHRKIGNPKVWQFPSIAIKVKQLNILNNVLEVPNSHVKQFLLKKGIKYITNIIINYPCSKDTTYQYPNNGHKEVIYLMKSWGKLAVHEVQLYFWNSAVFLDPTTSWMLNWLSLTRTVLILCTILQFFLQYTPKSICTARYFRPANSNYQGF